MKGGLWFLALTAVVSSCLGATEEGRSTPTAGGGLQQQQPQQPQPLPRQLGSIASYSNTGKWLEFQSKRDGNGTDLAFGCGAVPGIPCSDNVDSVPLGTVNNNSPWTFASTGCTKLTVIEGWFAGDTTYQIFNNGIGLGRTSTGDMNSDCWDDPNSCYSDPLVGKAQFLLPAGSHSLTIQKVYQQDEYDGGWMRLESATCPCSTKTTACTATTTACCPGLVCRRVNVNRPPKQCLTCLTATKKCTTNGDCCSKKCRLQNGVKKCK